MDQDVALHSHETILREFKALRDERRVPETVFCTHTRLVSVKRRGYMDIDLSAVETVELQEGKLLNKFVLGGLGLFAIGGAMMSVAPTTALVVIALSIGCIGAGSYLRPSTLIIKTTNDEHQFRTNDSEAAEYVALHATSSETRQSQRTPPADPAAV